PETIRGKPAAVTGTAKGLRRRRDDAERRGVLQSKAVSRRRAIIGERVNPAIVPAQNVEHLGACEYTSRRPLRRAADVHVLDEADLRVDGLAVLDQVAQLIGIDVLDDDGIEFQAGEGSMRGADAVLHTFELVH